jgi:hypothetical protein
MASLILPRPTADELINAEKEFNHKYHAVEWTLTQLFREFPANANFDVVAVKVKVLNVLYGTQVRAVNIVAQHIVDLGVDPHLRAGEPESVDRIARVQLKDKVRIFFSFATKYCSWHNPDAYPIYDSYAEAALWYYKKRDSFATFSRDGYGEYVRRVNAFRDFYGLTAFNFKQIDKLLYSLGEKLMPDGSIP